MYSNVVILRQWSKIGNICRSLSTIEAQKLPQNSKSSDGISPPARIPRGPTDILQALASTVGPDPTAAHYKYHDDPFLIPSSNYRKRAYALSAEAGRKAAAWIRDEHAELFTTREWDPPTKLKTPYFNADPHIEALAPKPIYNDETKVTEQDLTYTIENALLEDAIKVFQLLGGTDGVNEDLKIKFLQLLCFCNEKEPVSAEWLEERWFSAVTRERQSATWKLGGLADKIFTSLEPKTPEAYCTIIQGMAKYYQAERAHFLSQEAIEKGIPLSTGVYNALLSCIGFLKEGTTLRINALYSLLVQMKEQGISPNHSTLSACLRSLSAWGSGKQLQENALKIVAEFKSLGIEPGLTAYYYLLCLFCKDRGPRIDIMSSILDDLEKRDSLEPKEATDTNFFITAMGVCSDHLQSITLAERLNALIMKDDNYKLVGDAYKESIYYRHFVTVACRHAPFERAMEILDALVPNVYVPEPSVMEEIIKTLEVGGAGERLAGVWSQLVSAGLASRVRLVERLLDAMCHCYPHQDDEVKEKIRQAAADIIKFSQITDERDETEIRRSPTQKLSASALANIIELCADTSDRAAPQWDSVTDALQRLRAQQAVGVPARPAALVTVAERAASLGKHAVAASAVSYLAECGFEEALDAGVKSLSAVLNRTPEEVDEILKKNPETIAASLHPDALAIVEAYHLTANERTVRRHIVTTAAHDNYDPPQARPSAYTSAQTGSPMETDTTSSSDSDSESSSDDER